MLIMTQAHNLIENYNYALFLLSDLNPTYFFIYFDVWGEKNLEGMLFVLVFLTRL